MWTINGQSCLVNSIPTLACIVPLYRIALGTAMSFIGVASLFMLIFAGIKLIMSGGGKQIEEAKNMITYAIIGLIIVLLASFIIAQIASFTGLMCIMTFGLNSCN